METTEKIVEAYVRYVKGWFTIPNIKCPGQKEIDILAVDVSNPSQLRRYHIESGVSISGSYSNLTVKDFSPEHLKIRVKQAEQRRTLGYFIKHKFNNDFVIEKLKSYNFLEDNYQKVVVSWKWDHNVEEAAERASIELWDFREILKVIASSCCADRTYFTDDTMRTLQLMAMAMGNSNSKTHSKNFNGNVAKVHAICEELAASLSHEVIPARKDVIKAAESLGIPTATASTQYQAWKKRLIVTPTRL